VEPSLDAVTAAAAGAELTADTDFRVSITNAPGAGSYPIASYTWLLVMRDNANPGAARAVRQFLEWMLSDAAQGMARDMGYAPLPSAVAGLVRDRLGTLMAEGQPLN